MDKQKEYIVTRICTYLTLLYNSNNVPSSYLAHVIPMSFNI